MVRLNDALHGMQGSLAIGDYVALAAGSCQLGAEALDRLRTGALIADIAAFGQRRHGAGAIALGDGLTHALQEGFTGTHDDSSFQRSRKDWAAGAGKSRICVQWPPGP